MPTAPNITIGVKTKGTQKVEKDFKGLAAATSLNTKETAKLRKEQAKQARAEQIQAARRRRQIAEWKRYGKAIAGAAVALAAREVVRNTLEFETQMNRVAAVTGATGVAFANLAAQARNLGATTKFAASEVAAGQAFLGQAGFKMNEIISATPALLDLAAAGMLDLGRAADIASNIMGAFQIAAKDTNDVADVMAATAASSNTNIEQLGEAMSYVGPVAYSAGLSLRDAATAIGILGNNALQGSRAGTGLNTIISRLLRPSSEATKIFEGYNIELRDASGNLRNFIDILGELHAAGAGTEDFFAIFEQRGAPAALILAQNAERAKEYRMELDDVKNASNEMANVMETGLVGAMHNLKSAWEGLTISMGKNPLLNDLILKPIEGLTELFRSLTPEVETMPATVAALGDAYAAATAKIAMAESQLAQIENVSGRNAARRRETIQRTIDLLTKERDATLTLTGLRKGLADLDKEIAVAHRREIPVLERRRERLLDQIRQLEADAEKAEQETAAAAAAGRAAGGSGPSQALALQPIRPAQQAVAAGVLAWRDYWQQVGEEAKRGRASIEADLDDLAGYVPLVSGTRMQKLQRMISMEINRAGAARAQAAAAFMNLGPDSRELPEYIARTDSLVKRLGDSFALMGDRAADSLKQIVIQGANAQETVKRLLVTLGIDFLRDALSPGGLFRPTKKNVGGTIYPGRAYRVHEDETIIPLGSPMQVQPARSGAQGSPGNVSINVSIDGYDRDQSELARAVAEAVEGRIIDRQNKMEIDRRVA